MALKMNRAIFFDKDGTLVVNVPYNVDPEKVRFTEGAPMALSLLRGRFQFHVVTNQAGVSLGLFQEEALLPVHRKLENMFLEFGVELSGFHYCPHQQRDGCECRKPGTLMFRNASRDHNIDLKRSWLIGDILDDIEAGKRSGCKTILLDIGHETEWVMTPLREPDFRVKTLDEAARIILESEDQYEFMERC
jgi:D-glycero-D-manno-heptose 1,7-bisphosphate phosphatase